MATGVYVPEEDLPRPKHEAPTWDGQGRLVLPDGRVVVDAQEQILDDRIRRGREALDYDLLDMNWIPGQPSARKESLERTDRINAHFDMFGRPKQQGKNA